MISRRNIPLALVFVVLAPVLATIPGCGKFDLESRGHLDEPCFLGEPQTCRGNLACLDGVCKNPADGDTETDGDTEIDGDTAPDGDTTPDGDTVQDGDTQPDGDTAIDGDPDEDDMATDGDSQPDGDPDIDGDITVDLLCADGICLDPATGFEWQQEPAGGTVGWDAAIAQCQGLDLGGSGWKLPNISELRTLVRGCPWIGLGGSCGVQDTCGPCGVGEGEACLGSICRSEAVCNPSACTDGGGPGGCFWPSELRGACSFYWSASAYEDTPTNAWSLFFDNGYVSYHQKNFPTRARCLRDETGIDGDEESDGDAESDPDPDLDPDPDPDIDEVDTAACTTGPCCNNGDWRAEGEPCISGNNVPSCAEEKCTANHDCLPTPLIGYCLVEGVCISHGEDEPGNECRYCDAYYRPTEWLNKPSGQSCESFDQCYQGACVDCTNLSGCTDLADDGKECSEASCNTTDHQCYHKLDARQGLPCGDDSDTVCTNPDTCDASGVCQPNHENAGNVCNDDGNKCNGVSTCVSGSCNQTTAPVTCTALDECHSVGTCNTSTGICSNPNKSNGTTCGTLDQCVSGTCRDCYNISGCTDLADDGKECSEPACDIGTYQCYHKLDVHQGFSCNDDNTCSHTDTCGSEGECMGTVYTCNSHGSCQGDNTCICSLGYFLPRCEFWSQRFGGSSREFGKSVAADSFNNILVLGYFDGAFDLGGGMLTSTGSSDIFLGKFSSTGNHLWSKRFGGSSSDEGNSIAVDPDGNVVITGVFYNSVDFGGGTLSSAGISDIFLAKYSPTGGYIWSQRFGGATYDEGHAVAIDSMGNIFITGTFYGSVNFGGSTLTSAGESDVFLAKYSSSGAHLWSKHFGGGSHDSSHSVTVDYDNNIVLTGIFKSSVNFGGDVLTSAGGYDIFLAKYSSSGSHLWSKRFGNGSSETGRSVSVDLSGDVVLVGTFKESVNFGGDMLTSAGYDDIFLAKYSSSGTHLWSKRFGGTNDDECWSTATDPSGNVIIKGDFSGAVNFGGGALSGQMVIAKYSALGEHIWSYGYAQSVTQGSVSSDTLGNILGTGFFLGSIDFGGGTFTAAGEEDLFLIRLSP